MKRPNTHEMSISDTNSTERLPTILIVEDDKGLNRLIQLCLKREGFETAQAFDGATAIEIVYENPDVIMLLDFMLPDMTGEEVVNTLKARDLEIPFIVMTGYEDTQTAVQMMKAGARDYIVKQSEFVKMLPHVIRQIVRELEKEQRLAEAEQSLRKSQADLQKAQSIAHLGNWEWDLSTGKVIWSEEIYQIFGVEYQEPSNKLVRSLVHPEDLEFWQQSVRAALYENASFRIDYRTCRPDGSIRWIHNEAEILRDAQGEPVQLFGIAQDITERKHADNQLKRQAAILNALINSPQETVAMLDTEGRIISINLNGAKRFGMSPEEMVGRNIYELLSEPVASERKKIISEVMRTGRSAHFEDQRGFMHFINSVYSVNDPQSGELLGTAIFAIDITERKRREKALQNLNTAIKIMPLGLFITDLDGKITYTNFAAAEMHGYQEHELIGQIVCMLVPPDLRRLVTLEDISSWQGLTRESLHLRKDGSTFPVQLISEIVKDAKGEPCTIVTSCEDITERKQAEMALQESEERYRLMVESSPYGIGILQDGNIMFVNPAACRLLGANHPQELIGLPIQHFVHPDGWQVTSERIRRMLVGETGLYPAEDRYVRLDGSVVPVEVIAAPFTYQGRPTIQVLATNMSERKLLEEQLLHLQKAVETMHLGVTVTDTERKILYTNQADAAMHGYTKEELIGQHANIFAPPHLRQSLMYEHIEAAQNWTRESVNIRKDGSTFLVQLISDVVRNPQGQAIAIVTTCEDITQRKQAEAALKKQTYDLEERVKELRCLFEISHLSDTEDLSLEEIFARSVRLLPSAWQYPDIACARILLDNQEFTTANFRETSWKQEHDILISNQRVGKIQVCYLEPRPVCDDGPFLKEERDLIRMVAERLGDVIHSRQAEEALRISEEKYRTLFETMAQGVVYQDAAGVIIGANPAAEKILGLTLDQMQGRTSFDPRWKAVHEDGSDFAGNIHPAMVALQTGQQVKDAFMGVFHPGEKQYHWININAIPQFKPDETTPYQVYTTFADITARKAAEDRLRQRLDIERTLANISTWFMQATDFDKAVLKSLEALGYMLEASRSYVFLLREYGTLMDNTHEWCAEGVSPQQEQLQNLPTSIFPWWMAELTAGHTIHIPDVAQMPAAAQAEKEILEQQNIQSLIVLPVYTGTNLAGFLGLDNIFSQNVWGEEEINVLQVVTQIIGNALQRRQTLEQLQRSYDIMEQQVEERTAELILLNEELARASKLKDEFLANMSHELRTPLNAVLGYAQVLQRAENLTERQQEGLSTIKKSGEYLLTLINDILDLAKIEAGHMEVHRHEVYLPDFLNHIADMMRVKAEQKGLSFVYDVAPDIPIGVIVDEKKLREILLNLLGNAIKFTEKGSVTLRVRSKEYEEGSKERAEHNVSLLPSPYPLLHFDIQDTGVGISFGKLEEIFEPFHQVGEERYSIEGTGLGLAISRKLVALMGGELKVESTFGEGSCFWFELVLPVLPDFKRQQAVSMPRVRGYTGKRRTLLVVDDTTENRNVLVDMLFPLGFHILEAENGKDCLEQVEKHQPDAILLDLYMPVLNGFETVHYLKQYQEYQKIVIIAVSAGAFDDVRQKSLDAGCDDFIVKPFELHEVLERLQRHLRLEWTYENITRAQSPTAASGQPINLSNLVLPEDVRRQLLVEAERGDVKKILEQLQVLEVSGEQFLPVVTELRTLAKNFDVDQIADIVQAMRTD